MIDRHRL